jgi:hypothetical protein
LATKRRKATAKVGFFVCSAPSILRCSLTGLTALTACVRLAASGKEAKETKETKEANKRDVPKKVGIVRWNQPNGLKGQKCASFRRLEPCQRARAKSCSWNTWSASGFCLPPFPSDQGSQNFSFHSKDCSDLCLLFASRSAGEGPAAADEPGHGLKAAHVLPPLGRARSDAPTGPPTSFLFVLRFSG